MKNNHPIIIGLFAFSALLLTGSVAFLPTIAPTEATALVLDANPVQATDTKPDPFSNITIDGTAAIILDPQTGEVIYAKNINKAMSLASITKVMAALVAEELIPTPSATIVTITKEDLAPEGDSGLVIGQTWRLKDLINFSLVSSSNDGIHAIARTAAEISHSDFIAAMNAKAHTLHLDQTNFKNESGLDIDAAQAGAYGSAEDIARLFAYVINNRPELLEATRHKTILVSDAANKTRLVTNTNEAVDQIPNLLGSKTGYTDLAGGNLAVVFDRGLGQKAVVVVLGSTQEARFSDVVQLTNAAALKLKLDLDQS